MLRRTRPLLAGIATACCLAALGWAGATLREPRLEVPSVGLHPAPNHSAEWREWVGRAASRWQRREVLLQFDDEFASVSLFDLGYSVDQERVLLALSEASKRLTTFDIIGRSATALGSAPLPPRDLPVPWIFDRSRAVLTLESLSKELRREPRDAALDFAQRELIYDTNGLELDVAASLQAVMQLSPNNQDMVELSSIEVPARVRRSNLPPVDPRKILAAFETDFSKKRGPRIHNIRTAARYLDGTVLEPGATFSFNKTVGARTASRGFVDAPVIVNDVMESGMGGGVCQVATTLHAAAIFGGLDITERRSHSRPSGYAPLGLDATVIDDVQDLRIKNPYSTAIYVRAYLPSRYVVRVELFGVELDGRVKHSNWVVERHPFTRRVVEKPELEQGTVKINQKGGFGYDTVSTVVLTSNGQRREYRYKSKYYPVPEVLWVGPGTPPSELPPLPETADPNAASEQAL